MFWQKEYIREGVSMTLNNTYILDLPESGLLGSILIRISGSEVSAYGQAGGDWRIVDKITKIVVLGDQSNIIKSMDGYQAHGMEAYDQGVMAPSMWRNYASNTQYEYLLINFGRFLYDRNFGLDLAKYRNVQLQVTNDANSTTEFTDLTISVLGFYLREAPAGQFAGYFATEAWRQWTTVSDETQYLTIPVDRPLRRIGLQAVAPISSYLNTTGAANMMDDIELSLDTGQTRLYKGGWDDLVRENVYQNGRFWMTQGVLYQSADKGADMGLAYPTGYAGISGSLDGAVSSVIPTAKGSENNRLLPMESYEADSPIQLVVFGLAPFGVAMIDFMEDWDPANLLDPATRKDVKLNVHTRSGATYAGGTNAVILDRLVR